MTHANDKPQGDAPLDETVKKEHASILDRIHKHRGKAKKGFQALKEHLAQESDETKNMIDTYQRWLEGKATKEEMREANEQFKDLIRIAGMGTFFGLVPGSMLLLPVAVYGANKVGIRLIPSAFLPDKKNQDDG